MQKLFLVLCNHAYAASILIIVIFLLLLKINIPAFDSLMSKELLNF